MFGWRRKKKYDTTIKLIDAKNLIELRSKVNILIVDDDEFGIVDLLNNRDFNVYYKNDMRATIEAEPFDIIIMDIKGIAKNLGSSMEGFALALDVKKKYPNKQVYCFSSTVKTEIAKNLKDIDGFIPKDYSIDQWAEQLDTIIADYTNIDFQWQVLEKQLFINSISQNDINVIKEEYYNSFKNKSFDNIDRVLMGVIKNTKVMFEILQSILSLIKILSE